MEELLGKGADCSATAQVSGERKRESGVLRRGGAEAATRGDEEGRGWREDAAIQEGHA